MHEDDAVIAFRDIAPRAPTHVLLIPRRHIPSALELTEADGPLLGGCSRSRPTSRGPRASPTPAIAWSRTSGRWGGQSVDHLHVHLMGGRSFDWPPG